MPAPLQPAELKAAAEHWLAADPNPATRAEVQAAVAADDVAALRAMFGTRLAFGTAGLRAAMGPGSARMNDVTVRQTTQGLIRYVQAQKKTAGGGDASFVVGYDGRHNSARWGRAVADVCAAAGCRCTLFPFVVPTPLVPYAVAALGADAGVMVTASHNPKGDNGYKVYWANAVQIIPPHDAGIQASILANLELWPAAAEAAPVAPTSTAEAEQLVEAYIARVVAGAADGARVAAASASASATPPPVTFAYTAMHGVGRPCVERAFAASGLPPPVAVASQADPDPEFPTVPFPNPEERGALAEATAAAEAAGAAVVLANDPDADRLAVAERAAEGGAWRVFTGNELGALLGAWAWERRPDGVAAADCRMLASMVSSRFLGAMAEKEGFGFETTLTGFKWLGNRTADLQAAGKTVLFAFEEAIGYMHPATGVLDKDGVSAAVAVAELAVSLYGKGKTLEGRLGELYARYGWHATSNSYMVSRDGARTSKVCVGFFFALFLLFSIRRSFFVLGFSCCSPTRVVQNLHSTTDV